MGSTSPLSSTLPPTDDEGQFFLEPEEIMSSRITKRNNNAVTQVLVRWKNSQPEDATWEDLAHIQTQFPQFQIRIPPVNSILVDKDVC